MEFDQPVLDGTQLLERIFTGGVVEVVEEYLAHSGGDGPHLWIAETFGNLFPGFLEPFADQLSREIDVRYVIEVDVHHREPEVRNRAHLLNPGQTGHGHFDRIGDEFLDFLGSQALGDGENLDQVR